MLKQHKSIQSFTADRLLKKELKDFSYRDKTLLNYSLEHKGDNKDFILVVRFYFLEVIKMCSF